MDIRKESLKKHYEWNGQIEVVSRVPINSAEDLSLAYTPGVATENYRHYMVRMER